MITPMKKKNLSWSISACKCGDMLISVRRIIGDYDTNCIHGLIFIMQGTSGQGKSTMAKQIQQWCNNEGISNEIFSTDDLFTDKGEYTFHGPAVPMAHQVNQMRVLRSLESETNAVNIVDNCNLLEWEQHPYLRMAYANGYSPVVIDLRRQTVRKNVHGVPRNRVMNNLDRSLEESDYGIEVTDMDETYARILKKLRYHTEKTQPKATLHSFGEVVQFLIDNTEMVKDE